MEDWRNKYWRYMGALGMVTAYEQVSNQRRDEIAKERGFKDWLDVLNVVENGC
jgi:hypothetical protein